MNNKSQARIMSIFLIFLILITGFTYFVMAGKPGPNVITGAGDSPDPQDAGSDITFVGTGTSSSSYTYQLVVCNTSGFSGGGLCDTGATLCTSSAGIASGTQASCTYTAQLSDGDTSPNSYWVNTENSNGDEWEAEADGGGSQGTFSVNAPLVAWNQSTLDLGESINNITSVLKINSNDINTDTKITCSGNCAEITTNWTQRTMSDGQSDEVLIICSNATQGVFQAVFNVTSDEDTSDNLLTVDCEIFSYGWLNVSIEKPDDDSNWVTGNENLTINATVACEGGSNAKCGTVSALARYNLTASPDTDINATEGANPFYILTSEPSELSELSENLTSYYKLDESSGEVLDAHGSNPGTNNGATTGVAGKINTAYDFEATENDYVSTPIDLTDYNDFSISFWCKPESFTTRGQIISQDISGNRVLYVEVSDTIPGSTTVTLGGTSLTATTLQVGVWTHFVITREGTTGKVYIDGNNTDTDTVSVPASSSITFRMGNRIYSGFNDPFDGLIDEVGFFERVITQAEVTELYSSSAGKSYPFINDQNSKSTNLNIGDSFYPNWTLNVTTASEVNYLIDVLFNSSYGNALVPDNNTADRTVNLNPSGEDTIKPTYSNNAHDNTIAGQSTLFSVQYNDDTALHPNGQYMFSTNNTGTWVNESLINFTSTPQTINISKILNSTEGVSVGYRWYVDDNVGNINDTEIFTLTTTGSDCSPSLNVDWDISDTQICDAKSVTTGTGSINILSGGLLYLINSANVSTTLLNLQTTGDQVFVNSGSEIRAG